MLPLCIRCKGKGLCGHPCPIIQRLKTYSKEVKNIKQNFLGSSPSVFVGRYGYPRVNLGILSPARIDENAWLLDAPSFWYKQRYELESIVEARSRLINSRSIISIKYRQSKILEIAQEISMAKRPVDTEFFLKKRPIPRISLDIRAPPIGAPALLRSANITENPKIPRSVDKIVNDELKASNAINELYKRKVDVNQITRIFSVGLLGNRAMKKLVPTRWSITAVDDILSKTMIKQIKDFPMVNNCMLFNNEYLGNHFEILLIPREWNFEVIEGKQPGSCWNPKGKKTHVYADWEQHFGRTSYADNVTGAYYADRLGVCEYLMRKRRQASVLIIREVKPEYMIPCGVWVNREAVRGAFDKRPELFDDLNPALKKIFSRISLDPHQVIKASRLLKEVREQKKLFSFTT